MVEDPAAKLERELRALLPVALALAHRDGKDRTATAEHLVRVVMTCARPLMKADDAWNAGHRQTWRDSDA